MRYIPHPPYQPCPSFCPAEHLQQPHAGRERAVAGRALLQERHRQILEESGAAVSAGSLASVASPLFPPLLLTNRSSLSFLFAAFNLGPYFSRPPTSPLASFDRLLLLTVFSCRLDYARVSLALSFFLPYVNFIVLKFYTIPPLPGPGSGRRSLTGRLLLDGNLTLTPTFAGWQLGRR